MCEGECKRVYDSRRLWKSLDECKKRIVRKEVEERRRENIKEYNGKQGWNDSKDRLPQFATKYNNSVLENL